MPEPRIYEIESINDSGVGVRVRFTWRGDRFGHTISFVRGNEEIVCVESCEGNSNDDWPPSPPVQEIHQQQTDGGKILFLTGMAGTAHWSMTVETRERTVSGSPIELLWFDAAVRVKSRPTLLGSSYQSLSPCKWIDMSGTLQAVGSPQAAVMFALPDGNNQGWHTPSTERRLVKAHVPDSVDSPTTIQWSYGVASAIV